MKRVLVADDNGLVRSVLRNHLADKKGLTVCEAGDGVEAIEKAKEFHPDLIVLDLVMPNLTGAQAASILKHEMPEVPIILFTLHSTAVHALTSVVGVDIVLDKSQGLKILMEHVENALQQHEKSSHPN